MVRRGSGGGAGRSNGDDDDGKRWQTTDFVDNVTGGWELARGFLGIFIFLFGFLFLQATDIINCT